MKVKNGMDSINVAYVNNNTSVTTRVDCIVIKQDSDSEFGFDMIMLDSKSQIRTLIDLLQTALDEYSED